MQAEGNRTTNASGKQWRLRDWIVDSAANELSRDGQTLRVEPKAMAVLTVLAKRIGQVVSRETLLSEAWPGVTVGDEALTQAIIKLRKVLGDNARIPDYIETIPKRGYRLLPREEPLGPETPVPTSGPAPAQVAKGKITRKMMGIAAVLLAVAGLAAYALIVRAPNSATELGELPPEVFAGNNGGFPTVSITPFENIGNDPKQAYLARGLAADLATDLSHLGALRVIAAAELPLANGAKALARYLVAGSVQRGADRIKINVRLISSESGAQLWSERYERPDRDLFAVQNEITHRLVEILAVNVTEVERLRLARRYTQNLGAYDRFLRGQAAFAVRSPADNEKARRWFRSAIGLDPGFARAYAGIALTYAEDYRFRFVANRPDALAKARQYAETAKQIDPALREVQWVLAYVNVQERKHNEAIAHLKSAIAIDPSYADAYALLGLVYTNIGKPANAIPVLRTAMRLNPNAGYLYYQHIGRAYLFLGDTELALLNLHEALARNPLDLEGRLFLAAALAAAGNRNDAEWEAEEIRVSQPDFSASRWVETIPMTDTRQRQHLMELLTSIHL